VTGRSTGVKELPKGLVDTPLLRSEKIFRIGIEINSDSRFKFLTMLDSLHILINIHRCTDVLKIRTYAKITPQTVVARLHMSVSLKLTASAEDWVSQSRAATMLNVGLPTIRKLVASGELSVRQIPGSTPKVLLREIQAIADRYVTGPAAG
jgi:hypothetical protein